MKWPQLRADRYVWKDVSKVGGVKDAVGQGLSKLPSLDPFADINPMLGENTDVQIADLCGISEFQNM